MARAAARTVLNEDADLKLEKNKILEKNLILNAKNRPSWAKPGLTLLAALDPIVDALDDSMLGNLTRTELKQLIHLLDRIRAAHA